MHGHERVHVIAVVGLEDNDLVRGIEQGHAGAVKSSSRAGGDYDLMLRIGLNFVVVAHLARDGAAQVGDAVEPGVRVESALDGGLSPGRTGSVTSVSQIPWARFTPPTFSHSTDMMRISD